MAIHNMESYYGQVRTPHDAIILFEACRMGMLPRVQRRLSEKERQAIRSGSVFVWDEREAGMRRWTDGKSWSASRVSGSFLTYREMEGKRGSSGVAPPPAITKTPESGRNSAEDGADGEEEPDGYRYKPEGLMKQSFSITTTTNQHLHLISYFSRAHPNGTGLPIPSTDSNFRTVRPAKDLYPESTLHDQQHVPAVVRSPIASSVPYTVPSPSPASYPRSGAAHSHAFAYGPQTHPFPIQAMPNPNGHGPPPYTNGYGSPAPPQTHLLPHYSSHPPIAVSQPPTNSADQPPSRREENSHPHLAPKPARYQHQQQASPIEPYPATTRQPPLPNSPNVLARATSTAPIDPRLTLDVSPTASSFTPINGRVSPRNNSRSSAERRDAPLQNGISADQAPTAAATIPTTTERPAAAQDFAGERPSAPVGKIADRPASRSPGGTSKNMDGPADIPSQKLAFHEDQRALKALDKVFI